MLNPVAPSRLLVCLAMAGCASVGEIAPPIGEDRPLPRAEAGEVSLDLTRLREISDQLSASDEHEVHGIVVVHEGEVAFEGYYNGYGPTNPHDIRSATKSITSLLVGIALDEGAIDDVDDPVSAYLPPRYATPSLGDDVRLRHLLTMSSGLDCDDGDRSTRGQEDRMYRSRDWVEYFTTLNRVHAPGDTVRYCTGGVVTLGEVMANRVDGDFAAFADRELFAPLGIRNYEWARFDGGTKVDTGGHLLLTPEAMAKIGMLVLEGGRWRGEQIVSAEWLRQSTEATVQLGGTGYGFLWWVDRVPFGDLQVDMIRASGNGGQTIFIVPAYDLVAVFTAGYYNSDETRVIYELFYGAVLSAVPEISARSGSSKGLPNL